VFIDAHRAAATAATEGSFTTPAPLGNPTSTDVSVTTSQQLGVNTATHVRGGH
jgi:hypothetical protein